MSKSKEYLEIAGLLDTPTSDYTSAKEQAAKIDDLLGFECARIEEDLFETHQDSIFSSSQQFWYGLDLQSMQTPYSEILEMIHFLKPAAGELWLDLGAAYGRMGIVIGFQKPLVRFLGYEFVQERVDEGNRIFKKWKLDQVQMRKEDIASEQFHLEEADLYFLYDFGSRADVYKVLEKLRLIAQTKKIRVIARGRGVKNWILMDFPWLYDIETPVHFLNWSVFRS